MKLAFALFAIMTAALFLYLPMETNINRLDNIPLLLIRTTTVAATITAVAGVLTIHIVRPGYIKAQISTIKRFRHLLFLMIKRDFITKYRRSVLGVLWSVLNPLLTMLVITMVFEEIFRFAAEPNFPVYFLSGQLIFAFFSESTTGAMSSIMGSAGTIKKVYVPRYIFPISKVLSTIVNLGFTLIAFLAVMLFTGAPFYATMLLMIIPILYLLVFCIGIGMLLSAVAVFFRDMNYIYGIFTTLLMFLTPIFYPVEILPDNIYRLIQLNPLFHFVSYFRDVALYGTIPGLWQNIVCIGLALSALCAGAYVKLTQQDKYILYL